MSNKNMRNIGRLGQALFGIFFVITILSTESDIFWLPFTSMIFYGIIGFLYTVQDSKDAKSQNNENQSQLPEEQVCKGKDATGNTCKTPSEVTSRLDEYPADVFSQLKESPLDLCDNCNHSRFDHTEKGEPIHCSYGGNGCGCDNFVKSIKEVKKE
jgi:hypothetical protein